MKRLTYSDTDFPAALEALCTRTAFSDTLDAQVDDILQNIRERGDGAVCEYARKFDNMALTPGDFLVTQAEIDAADATVDADTRAAIELAHANICEFSNRRKAETWSYSPRPGVQLGERFVPFDRVAAYIPGGHAPLVSTVLHTVTMARAAGVKDIVVTTPSSSTGAVNPAILHAASVAGATSIYRLGGVYAIGALAYGTQSIAKVDKIVGPGNAYVAAAKRKVYGHVALDLVAGPSEVMIIADASADPRFIAADMLAQAEHGSGHELAVLVTTCPTIADNAVSEITRQLGRLTAPETARNVVENGVYILLVQSLEDAVAIANRFAPEHLEIMTSSDDDIAQRITAAGAIFLGKWTPEPVGDFVAGPSHVLPTGGTATCFSGLTIDHFYRRISVIQYNQDALSREVQAIETFARIEELEAHGRSTAIRFQD